MVYNEKFHLPEQISHRLMSRVAVPHRKCDRPEIGIRWNERRLDGAICQYIVDL